MKVTTILRRGAVLLAPALLLPAVHAQQQDTLQIYGQAAVSLNTRSGVRTAPRTDLSDSPVSASYLGFRGREDLGGGTRALFRLESGLQSDTGSIGATVGGVSKFFNRQSYVGLDFGRAGTITFGRQFHAGSDRVIRTLDPQKAAGNFAFVPIGVFGVNRFVGNDTRVDNAVKYRFDSGSGFEAGISHGFSEGTAGASTSFDVGLDLGALKLGGGGVDYRAPTVVATTGDRPHHDAWAFGGQLAIASFTAYANILRSRLEPTVAGRGVQRNTIVTLGLEHRRGSEHFVAAAYLDRGKTLNGFAGRDGRKATWVFTAEHFLSARTLVFASAAINRFSDGYLLETLNQAALGRDATIGAVRMLSIGLRHAI